MNSIKYIALSGFISISVIITGQSIQIGNADISDAPMSIAVFDENRFAIALLSIDAPETSTTALPYHTELHLINQDGIIENTWSFENFIPQNIFKWNNQFFLFGSGNTNTGIYSLDLYKISETISPELCFHEQIDDTSLVARQAFVDSDGRLLLCSRRFSDSFQDFAFFQLDETQSVIAEAYFEGPEFSMEYMVAEIPNLPSKYFIRSSNGLNFFLGTDLTTFSVINSSMEPLNLSYESGLALNSDSSYFVVGDNVSIEGYGNRSAYLVERNVYGEVLSWFEAINESEGWTNHGSGMIVDSENQEIWMGLTAISEFEEGLVPEAGIGLAGYSLEGELLHSDFQWQAGSYISIREMLRFPNGNFVLAGICAPANETENANKLDVMISFFDNQGNFLYQFNPVAENYQLQVTNEGVYSVSSPSVQPSMQMNVYDTQGRLLEHHAIKAGESGKLRPNGSGIYLFQLIMDERVLITRKQFVQGNNH